MTKGFDEIKLQQEEGLKIVTLKLNNKIDKNDYELFAPQLERLMRDEDRVRILLEMRDFKGFSIGALWEETKFAFKHFNDIDRIAVVGDSRLEKKIAGFAKPFTRAEVRYFISEDKEKAKSWLHEKPELK